MFNRGLTYMNSEGKPTPSTKNEKRRWSTPQLTIVGDIRTFVRSSNSKSGIGTDGGSHEPKKDKGWDTWDTWDSGDNWDDW